MWAMRVMKRVRFRRQRVWCFQRLVTFCKFPFNHPSKVQISLQFRNYYIIYKWFTITSCLSVHNKIPNLLIKKFINFISLKKSNISEDTFLDYGLRSKVIVVVHEKKKRKERKKQSEGVYCLLKVYLDQNDFL